MILKSIFIPGKALVEKLQIRCRGATEHGCANGHWIKFLELPFEKYGITLASIHLHHLTPVSRLPKFFVDAYCAEVREEGILDIGELGYMLFMNLMPIVKACHDERHGKTPESPYYKPHILLRFADDLTVHGKAPVIMRSGTELLVNTERVKMFDFPLD